MKKNLFFSFILAIYFFIGTNINNASAELDQIIILKRTYNISDTEIEDYIAKIKKTNPEIYNSLVKIKETSPDAYGPAILSNLISSKMSNIQSGKVVFGESFEDYKKMYNISDAELENFFNKVKNDNPSLYRELMKLKDQDLRNYNNALLGGVTQYRLKDVKTSYLDNLREIQEISLKMLSEQSNYLSANNNEDKQIILQRLRNLAAKKYDLTIQGIDEQIKNLKSQEELLEKNKQQIIAKKDAFIEETVRGLIGH